MRPDPSDIIAKKRLRKSTISRGYMGRPLEPVNLRFISLIVGGIIFSSIIIFAPFNFDDAVNYFDRPITKIKMENQWEHIDSSEIRNLVSVRMGTGFFRFDVQGLKSDLEKLSWVDEASINRLWPDTLSLHLREQVAIAYWNEEGFLNSRGEVFSPGNADKSIRVPYLYGPDGSQKRIMEQFESFNKLFAHTELSVSGIRLSDRGSWNLTIDDSMQIAVGREKLSNRLKRFIKLYEKSRLTRNFQNSEVDLRYENGIAVKNLATEMSELAYRGC